MKGLSNLCFSRLSNLPKIKVVVEWLCLQHLLLPKENTEWWFFFFFFFKSFEGKVSNRDKFLFCLFVLILYCQCRIFQGITALHFILVFSSQPLLPSFFLFLPIVAWTRVPVLVIMSDQLLLFHCAIIMLLKAETEPGGSDVFTLRYIQQHCSWVLCHADKFLFQCRKTYCILWKQQVFIVLSFQKLQFKVCFSFYIFSCSSIAQFKKKNK